MIEDREKLYDYSNDEQFKGKTAEEIFTGIYKSNIWLNEESVSGNGSSLEQANEIITKLPAILNKFGIKTLLDIPCGDFNWMRYVINEGINYTGVDIVEEIIDADNKKYALPNVKFIKADICKDVFDKHDLVLCRDCLVHFSFDDIKQALANIKTSGSKYFMTTTFTEQKTNKDIHTGGWRPLNFEIEPFGLGAPVALLNEKCTEADNNFTDKCLAMWEVEKL